MGVRSDGVGFWSGVGVGDEGYRNVANPDATINAGAHPDATIDASANPDATIDAATKPTL